MESKRKRAYITIKKVPLFNLHSFAAQAEISFSRGDFFDIIAHLVNDEKNFSCGDASFKEFLA